MASAHLDWVERARILELENQRLMECQEATLNETNRKLLLYLTELRTLRKKTETLTRENDELRRLCCHLDDDRETLIRTLDDWKEFGSQAASFMQNEVSLYKENLQLLENRQNELLTENQYLHHLLDGNTLTDIQDIRAKSISIHLNSAAEIARDSGDGSSETDSTDLLKIANAETLNLGTMQVGVGDLESYERKYQASTRPKFSASLPRYASRKQRQPPVDTGSCVLECIKNLESRLRKLEENKATVSSQAHVMQTSISAPDLEIICQNCDDEQKELSAWSDSEDHSESAAKFHGEWFIQVPASFGLWNTANGKDANAAEQCGDAIWDGVDGRNCNAA